MAGLMKKTVLLLLSFLVVFNVSGEKLWEKMDRKIRDRDILYDEIQEIKDKLTTIVKLSKIKDEPQYGFRISIFDDPYIKIQKVKWVPEIKEWEEREGYYDKEDKCYRSGYGLDKYDVTIFKVENWKEIKTAIDKLLEK